MSQATKVTDAWYCELGGQQHGPVSGVELKNLVVNGQLAKTDRVRREGMTEWVLAGQIKGLFAVAPAPVESGAPEITPRTFVMAEQQVETVSRKLWFLDLTFRQFATPKIIGFLWALYLIGACMMFGWGVFSSLMALPVLFAALAVIGYALLTVFVVMFTRVFFEFLLVIFRVNENLGSLKHLEYLRLLETKGKS